MYYFLFFNSINLHFINIKFYKQPHELQHFFLLPFMQGCVVIIGRVRRILCKWLL
jgi:hypothetical protein